MHSVGDWSGVLGKTSQLWPGHIALKPEFVLERKEKTSSHLWDTR